MGLYRLSGIDAERSLNEEYATFMAEQKVAQSFAGAHPTIAEI